MLGPRVQHTGFSDLDLVDVGMYYTDVHTYSGHKLEETLWTYIHSLEDTLAFICGYTNLFFSLLGGVAYLLQTAAYWVKKQHL